MLIENLKSVNSQGSIMLDSDDYVVSFVDYHQTSCCEVHYIAWEEGLDQITEDMRFTFDTDNWDSLIERVEGYGIRLIPNPDTGHPVAFPGYASNNGMYSDELTLKVLVIDKNANGVVYDDTIDITDCQSYRWD